MTKIKERNRRKAALNDRKSAASQARMKSIANLAADERVPKRKRKAGTGTTSIYVLQVSLLTPLTEDMFGADDADWQIYRKIVWSNPNSFFEPLIDIACRTMLPLRRMKTKTSLVSLQLNKNCSPMTQRSQTNTLTLLLPHNDLRLCKPSDQIMMRATSKVCYVNTPWKQTLFKFYSF